jgi:hypothetical protein
VERNLTKNSNCKSNRGSGERPPFVDVPFWFEGGAAWDAATGCNGCGWAYPEACREGLSERAGSATRVRNRCRRRPRRMWPRLALGANGLPHAARRRGGARAGMRVAEDAACLG